MTKPTCNTCKKEMIGSSITTAWRTDCGGDCIACMAQAGDPECVNEIVDRGIQALDALDRINGLIFGDGAPLGSDHYFAIRGMCTEVLYSKEKPRG